MTFILVCEIFRQLTKLEITMRYGKRYAYNFLMFFPSISNILELSVVSCKMSNLGKKKRTKPGPHIRYLSAKRHDPHKTIQVRKKTIKLSIGSKGIPMHCTYSTHMQKVGHIESGRSLFQWHLGKLGWNKGQFKKKKNCFIIIITVEPIDGDDERFIKLVNVWMRTLSNITWRESIKPSNQRPCFQRSIFELIE